MDKLSCAKNTLEFLQLRNNSFTGPFLDIAKFSSLKSFYANSNKLNWTLPVSLGTLHDFSGASSLQILSLSHNKIKGILLESIGNLSILKLLDLSYNSLNAIVSEYKLSNLYDLQTLDVFDNSLKSKIMASPPASPPPPPPPSDTLASPSAVKRTCKATCLRSLSTRPPGAERLVVHIDPATGKADGPHRKKLRTYLGVVARDKVDVTYENWKEVEFEIPEASDNRTKKKLLKTRQFKTDLTRKWALAADQDDMDDTVCEKYDIIKKKWAQFCQTRKDPSWENTSPHILSRGGYEYLEQKLLAEKTKKNLEEVAQLGSVDGVIDPSSPVRCHVKWKMARTKKIGEMTTEAAKEIIEKMGVIDLPSPMDVTMFSPLLLDIQSTLDMFVLLEPIGSTDVLQLFLTTSLRITAGNPANQGPARRVDHKKSDSAAHGIVQPDGLALPPEPLVGPSGPRVSTKKSCVDSSANDPETGDSDRCGLYIKANPAHLVTLGRVYEGSIIVHNTSLLSGQVKVGVEEVKDPDAPVPVPIDEVSLVGQAIHTFLAWPTHLAVVSPTKPPQTPDLEVDDPLYLMTLTILELFLRPYQVTWDATVFGVFNPNFPLYIEHQGLSEIAHGDQCLSISVLQLWILHLTETSMRAGNSDLYGFLEPQSIQRSGQLQFEAESYIKSWMRSSKRDVYLGTYLNGGHWQMVVILPKEHLVVLFCLDDAAQPKSKAAARWIAVKYFNDPRPLEPERLKALQI
ncbi:Receptor-like protein EIX1 [Glycine max]|nr:Receptor-like protein EIX1 [Glycine max]